MLQVRPYQHTDEAFILGLAPRLAIGRPPWRDAEQWHQAVTGWLRDSIAQHPHRTAVFVAENDHGEPLGFACVTHSRHFSGQGQASIGELATTEAAEGQGVGRALVQACVDWARIQGYGILTLSTGAANTRARRFYQQLGFHEEDVSLVKLL
jgi:GNAT superfamily N-acetyltransferase